MKTKSTNLEPKMTTFGNAYSDTYLLRDTSTVVMQICDGHEALRELYVQIILVHRPLLYILNYEMSN